MTANAVTKYDILIDLSKKNTVKNYPDDQLFQPEAYEQAKRYFEEAKKWFDDIKNKDFISDCRNHNTILISGSRGSGKTIFLVNLAPRHNNDEIHKSFEFLEIIDPTLLNGTQDMESSESFIAVIVGLINNWAENKLKNKADDKQKNDYYTTLRDVAESVQTLKSARKEYGIDEIYAHQSALSLEQNLHLLFGQASKLAGDKILVIRIDDIDMAFKHGFQVLEALRKYLASPYVLPVLSGDSELYRNLVEKDFSEAMESPLFCVRTEQLLQIDERFKHIENNRKIVSELSEKYMTKVMPFDQQIHLKNVSEIIQSRSISIELENNEDAIISYKDIKEYEDEFLNHGINRNEYKNKDLSFDSVRIWLQYLEKMRDWYTKRKELKGNDDKKWFELYKDFQTKICEFTDSLKKKEHLTIVAKSNLQASTTSYFDHNRLLYSDFFNPEKNKFYTIHEEGDFDNRTFKGWHFIAKSQFDLESKSDRAQRNLSDNYKPIEQFLLGLFTFDNYYSRSHQTWMFLFAGKFIEFIFSSLNPQYWVNGQFNYSNFCTANPAIINKKPLFSKLDIKTTFIERNNFSKEFLEENSELNIERFIKIKPEELDQFFIKHATMQKKNDNSTGYEVKIKDFIDAHFMHEVLKRFINNLNIYRNNKLPDNELFIHYMQRCSLMLVNAVAACERQNSDKIAFQNIAIQENFDIEKIYTSDNSYNINIAPFINMPDSLTYLLLKHPLIDYILKLKASSNKSLNDEKIKDFTALKVSLTKPDSKTINQETTIKETTIKETTIKETTLRWRLHNENSDFSKFKSDLEKYLEIYPDIFKRKLIRSIKSDRPATWFRNLTQFCLDKSNLKEIYELFNKYNLYEFSDKFGFK